MSEITFHDLTYHRRGNEWVAAYEPTGAYALIDDTGKRLIQELKKHPVSSVKEHYPDHDIDEFIDTLQEHGLIHKRGHRVVDHKKKITDLLDLPKKYLRWAKHPVTIGIILGLIATGTYLLLTHPQLVPAPSWFYATGWYAALLPTIVLAMFGISALHELGHYAALKATGHTTGVHLEQRWHFIRPRTNIDNAQLLRPAAKNGVYAAGILVDLAVMSIAIITVHHTGNAIAKLVALLAFLHALGQFTPHKQADLMRIASHQAGVDDITTHFPKALKSICPFCNKKQETFSRHAAPLLVTSSVVLAIILGAYALPFIGAVIADSIKHLLLGATGHDPSLFIDGLFALLMLSITAAFSTTAQLRDHPHNDKSWFRSLMTALFSLSTFTAVALISVGLIAYATIPTTFIAMLLLGTIYGVLLTRYTQHFKHHEYHVPVLAVTTAALLIAILGASTYWLGATAPVALYATMYSVGVLASSLI